MKGSDFKAMCRSGWAETHINDNEPIVFKRPRVIGRQRVLEKRRRFSFATDEQNFSELAALREAYILTCNDNPTLATHGMIMAMKTFDLKGWLEQHQGKDE